MTDAYVEMKASRDYWERQAKRFQIDNIWLMGILKDDRPGGFKNPLFAADVLYALQQDFRLQFGKARMVNAEEVLDWLRTRREHWKAVVGRYLETMEKEVDE